MAFPTIKKCLPIDPDIVPGISPLWISESTELLLSAWLPISTRESTSVLVSSAAKCICVLACAISVWRGHPQHVWKLNHVLFVCCSSARRFSKICIDDGTPLPWESGSGLNEPRDHARSPGVLSHANLNVNLNIKMILGMLNSISLLSFTSILMIHLSIVHPQIHWIAGDKKTPSSFAPIWYLSLTSDLSATPGK